MSVLQLVVRGVPGSAVVPNPFATEEQGYLFPDGWVALARIEPYRVDWRRPDGTWLRGDPLPFNPIRTQGESACGLLGASEQLEEACRDGRLSDLPEVLPPFLPEALLGAPDGTLLVKRVDPSLDGGNSYDLIDRDGELDGVLAVAPGQRVVGFGANSVYVVTSDEFALEWLTRHPWR